MQTCETKIYKIYYRFQRVIHKVQPESMHHCPDNANNQNFGFKIFVLKCNEHEKIELNEKRTFCNERSAGKAKTKPPTPPNRLFTLSHMMW